MLGIFKILTMPATKEYNKKYYREHIDYYRNYNKQWYEEHRDEKIEYNRELRRKNKELYKQRARVQYDKQSERLHEQAIKESECNTRLTEKWLPIPGYEGIYDISNWGLIRSITKRGRFKYSKGSKDKEGYRRFVLQKNGERTKKGVHYLVALTFIPVPDDLKNCEVIEPHHINENKNNNLEWNLMWVTKKMNINAGTRTERARNTRKKNKREG